MTNPVAIRERAILREMSTCVHFSGIQNDTCQTGVAYRNVRDDSVRPYRYPCLGADCASHCDHRTVCSRQEAEQIIRERDDSISRLLRAREAIVAATEGRRSVRGETPCPCCASGLLRYTIASNGHIHAACSTRDCVQWME